MSGRRWSLANRLTWWVSLVTTAPLALAFVVGGLFLERSVSREINALVNEELEEARSHLGDADDVVIAFEPISRKLAADHPRVPLAWRIFDARTGDVLAEYGETSILDEETPPPAPLDQSIHLGDGRWAKTVTTIDGINLGLVLDGEALLASLYRYWIVAGGLFALGGVIALVASRVLARRVAALIRGVAKSVSAEPADQGTRPTAPDEVRQVAENLRRDFRRVRDEAERVTLFTAGLAHELRSPIQNLMGQAEVALMSQGDPTSYRALLSSQLEELANLGDVVDNLLTICTINSNHGSAREVFDLAEEAELRLTREQARGHQGGVDVRISATGDTSMSGDREHVLRGLRNVVANAVDWSPKGGRVEVSLDGEGNEIVVIVDDDGPGVPAGDRTRVFEPFVQGMRRKRARIGYGLGLAIAKASVEGQGGRIAVDSSPSGGARFRMTFKRGIPA